MRRAVAEGQVQEMKQKNRRVATEKNEVGVAETRYRASAPSILCGLFARTQGNHLWGLCWCVTLCALCVCAFFKAVARPDGAGGGEVEEVLRGER